MESILNSIKKLLGIAEDYTYFDTDIIMHINSVFSFLEQMGVGPKEGFVIHDAVPTWSEYTNDLAMNESVKTYVYIKVKMVFDPPSGSGLLDSMTNLIKEYEWRLHINGER